jgi:hypothetical protein
MFERDSWGVESLPVVLLLGAALAACTLGLGLRCLGDVQRLGERQRTIESFNTFVERARMVSAGGVGNAQEVELELGGGRISIDAEVVQLSVGEEVLRVEILPLPIRADDIEGLCSGTYVIELQRDVEGRYFLGVRRP